MAERFLTESVAFFLKNADGGLSVVQFSRYQCIPQAYPWEETFL